MICARCQAELTDANRIQSFVGAQFCVTCMPIVNWQHTVDYPPLPKTPTGVVIHDPADDYGVIAHKLTFPLPPR